MLTVNEYFNHSCTLANAGKERLVSYFKPVSSYAETFFSEGAKETIAKNRVLIITVLSITALGLTGLSVYYIAKRVFSKTTSDAKPSLKRSPEYDKNTGRYSSAGCSFALPNGINPKEEEITFILPSGVKLTFFQYKDRTKSTIDDDLSAYTTHYQKGLNQEPKKGSLDNGLKYLAISPIHVEGNPYLKSYTIYNGEDRYRFTATHIEQAKIKESIEMNAILESFTLTKES
ncbi:MAG: hypothetical protein SNF33_07205 [Candidatus Algichlamydia australiensis]|nr:hypothetical protein [Chlamydiales bacterium]